MISYRFLTPAEEEMTEATLFYEAASRRLGTDFLDDVQRAIDRLCNYPLAGEGITSIYDEHCCTVFRSASFTP